MWAVLHTGRKCPVAQIGQSLIIMPRRGGGGNAGIRWECTVGLLLDAALTIAWIIARTASTKMVEYLLDNMYQ
jgi:hypothetical protein